MKNLKNKKGFTLIEMLVVIAIIAILVAIIIPTVSNATTKAKQATDVANIRSAIAQYQIENLNGEAADTFDLDDYNVTLNIADNWDPDALTYTADLLQDDPYHWEVGDLVTED